MQDSTTTSNHAAQQPFHGKAVLRAAFISGVFGWGIGFYGPPVFLYAVVAATGWSLSAVSAAITLHFLWGALVVAFLPRFNARFGLSAVTATGASVLSVGLVGWAWAQQPWQLYLAAMCTGAGWVTMSAAGLNAMVAPWFVKDRPMALSKAYNGASVGGMVFAPVWSLLIASIGFRSTSLIVAACTLVIMLWISTRILRLTPEMLGQQPDGPSPTGARRATTTLRQNDWPKLPGSALWRNRQFQTLAAAMSLSLFAQIGMVAHLYSLLVPQLGAQGAGWSMTLMTACAIVGRMLFAKALFRTNERRLLNCANYAMQIVGALLLLGSSGPGAALWLGLVLFGAGIGNNTSLPPLIAQSDFSASDVARVVALIVAISQGLYAFAPLAFSLLLKIPPGNLWLFVGAAALQALALVVLWAGRPGWVDQPTNN